MSENTALEIRKQENLISAFEQADNILMKNYQYDLSEYKVVDLPIEIANLDVTKHLRLFKIQSISYNKVEDSLTKLSNVYNALSAVGGSLVLIIDSDEEQMSFYIGTKTSEEKDIYIANKTLENTLKGNFPGCVIKNITKTKLQRAVDNLFYYRDESSLEEYRTISSVSGISSVKNFGGNSSKTEFTQGIEKLIDSMRGEVYSVVIIADPVPQSRIDLIKKGYEQLYTKLVPFSSTELSMGLSEVTTLTNTITEGVTSTISESLSLSQSHSNSTTTTNTSSSGFSFFGFSSSSSDSRSTTNSSSSSKTKTEGTSRSDSFSEGHSDSISKGETRTLQIRTEEKSVQVLLDKIDKQLDRLSECGDLGMWNCSAYFIADDLQISKTAASTYQALIRGENSGLEAITINTWSHQEDNTVASENYQKFSGYLQKLTHPQIYVGENLPIVNPTSLISGAELTIQAGLPQQSVSGLAVVEYAAFGREILMHSEQTTSSISLGKIYHMGITENSPATVNTQSLTSHTFITGSTGSGKSNTIYKMLDEICPEQEKIDVRFMVIEPAKGEYKDVFGGRGDVIVYGTNPLKSKNMLQINPFTFPNDIHVLEHIDRLVEIFNACWPMYAAMPAILKEAIERAYEECGFNLRSSKNNGRFPTFDTVLDILPTVIESSGYSNDTSSDYKGALITRVRSLTKGIYGMIFESSIDDEKLFNENTIVDFSRIGSNETKSLIMGILVLKLQEFRMSEKKTPNSGLKHITVLEEAHNLLRRTSSEQSQESSNLQGKSVEMIANAIAEMRTYGEGFIIADQSPGLMDMSVIRNTNTKIIMRLPDESDRQLVGRAAGLTDNQIIELSRLDTGVAAVYQNSWLEPVLCKVDEFKNAKPYTGGSNSELFEKRDAAVRKFLCNAFDVDRRELTKEEVDEVRRWIGSLGLSKKKKDIFDFALEGKRLSDTGKISVIYGICKHNGYKTREKMIVETKGKFESFGFIGNDDIVKVEIERLIISNIAENGERIKGGRVM